MGTNKEWQEIIRTVSKEVSEKFKEIYASIEFGAYIEPENYFVSYIFPTDKALADAVDTKLTEKIKDFHKARLLAHKYPDEGIKDCTFASQEECDRDFNGNWYYYYK